MVYPIPRKYKKQSGLFDYREAKWICLPQPCSPQLTAAAIRFAESVRSFFVASPEVTAGSPAAGRRLVIIRLVHRGMRPQTYRLQSRESEITLEAGDEAGAFYGLATLEGLLEESGTALLQGFEIEDEPDFPQRGVMLDISRCKVPTMETLFGLADLLAKMKINHLQLYMEHTFAYSAHRAVWQDSSPFTPREILELDRYCRERFISLVPNQNSFGHFERWLCLPEYRRYAELPDGGTSPFGIRYTCGTTLKPNRASLRLLASLYDELLPNFSAEDFNVGCDETWELGEGWSRDACIKNGTTKVYVDFLKKIHRLVEKRNRRMMFWGDIVLSDPKSIDQIPRDAIALDWGYEADHPFAKETRTFAESGHDFFVCPGTAAWNSLVGRSEVSVRNCANAARNGLKNGAIGYLVTDWGDGGHHQYLPLSYPGYVAAAGFSWCFRSNRSIDIVTVLNQNVLKDATGISGSILFGIGRVDETLSIRARNRSVFNDLLFEYPPWRFDPSKAPDSEYKLCLDQFRELERELCDARPAVEDGPLIKDEIRTSIQTARLGVLRHLNRNEQDHSDLRHRLREILAAHEHLWRARNRPGGMRESSDRLRGIFA